MIHLCELFLIFYNIVTLFLYKNQKIFFWLLWKKDIYWSAEVNIAAGILNNSAHFKSQHKRELYSLRGAARCNGKFIKVADPFMRRLPLLVTKTGATYLLLSPYFLRRGRMSNVGLKSSKLGKISCRRF